MSARVAHRMPPATRLTGRPRARRRRTGRSPSPRPRRGPSPRRCRACAAPGAGPSAAGRAAGAASSGWPRSRHQLLVARAERGAVLGPGGLADSTARPARSTSTRSRQVHAALHLVGHDHRPAVAAAPRPARRPAGARRPRRGRRRARPAAAGVGSWRRARARPRRWAMPRLNVAHRVEGAGEQADRGRGASSMRSPGVGQAVEVGVELQVLAGRQVEVDERVVAEVADLARARRRRRRAAVAGRPRGCPASGRSRVASMRSRVLLPAPFGPSTARHSPAASSTSTRSTARRSPKRFTRPSARTSSVRPTASPRRGRRPGTPPPGGRSTARRRRGPGSRSPGRDDRVLVQQHERRRRATPTM